MLSNCGAREDSRTPWTARSNQSILKEITLNILGIGDAKAEAPISWPPDTKIRLTAKYSDTGKDRRQKEKRVTEDEMVRWHHQLSGHEFEQTLGDSEGQGSLVYCRTWGPKESDTTEPLN